MAALQAAVTSLGTASEAIHAASESWLTSLWETEIFHFAGKPDPSNSMLLPLRYSFSRNECSCHGRRIGLAIGDAGRSLALGRSLCNKTSCRSWGLSDRGKYPMVISQARDEEDR